MATIPKPKVTLGEGMEEVDAAAIYDDKEWFMDPKGYFLIRANPETKKIEAGYCRQMNKILKKFTGNNASELCQAVLHAGVISRLDHAAYLGRECAKAQIAIKLNIPYVQDSELEL
jgi:tetrahydromethanopterin S-methyltransferase subunit A